MLAGRKHLSQESLQKVCDALDVVLDLVPADEVVRRALRAGDRAERLRELELRIGALDEVLARAEALPLDRRAEAVPAADPRRPDALDGLRARLANGRSFERAVQAELERALTEQANLAREVAEAAEARRARLVKAG